MLRTSASLNLETVLREATDNARTLTNARYAAIVALDVDGNPLAEDFVTSGMTDEEHAALAGWPNGPRLFEHFRILAPILFI